MRIPESLETLAEYGIIEEVVRPLMSGKEAQIYLVIASGVERVAKIYKEAENRSFKNRAEYTEGRKVRNTRDQRAIAKRTNHGRAQDEAAWRATEVNIIYRLAAAGVRVPEPLHFIDGVLVMELITDASGEPAPRLGDLSFNKEEAAAIYERLLRTVVQMLCAGVVHGDLSDFNVLMGADGPVLIDFPQAVDPAHNQNARKLLIRDVDNLHDFLTRFDRSKPRLPYAEEMWSLYQSNLLTPETILTGQYRAAHRSANTSSVMALIDDARRDERRRREQLGLKGNTALNQASPPGPGSDQRPDQKPTRNPGPKQVYDPNQRPAQNQAQNQRSGPNGHPGQRPAQNHGQNQRSRPNYNQGQRSAQNSNPRPPQNQGRRSTPVPVQNVAAGGIAQHSQEAYAVTPRTPPTIAQNPTQPIAGAPGTGGESRSSRRRRRRKSKTVSGAPQTTAQPSPPSPSAPSNDPATRFPPRS